MKPLVEIRLPIRVLLEVIIGTAMVFFIMFLWYITQPITITIVNNLATVAQDMNQYNTFVSNGVTILRYIVYWWGPLFIIAIFVLWLFAATQRRDWEGRYEQPY